MLHSFIVISKLAINSFVDVEFFELFARFHHFSAPRVSRSRMKTTNLYYHLFCKAETMDSPRSVVSPYKASIMSEAEKQKSDATSGSVGLGKTINAFKMDDDIVMKPDVIGSLEVYVHQAKDIQNICIYHKQDVYAKLCLTSNPEETVSTKIINGGGRNPVFNDQVELSVRTIDCSIKCEIYMMSRVRNYLEDQLLGLALVPLSEVLLKDGKLEKEFTLSATDLFHSPAGFVQLSLTYNGALPDVWTIPSPALSNGSFQESEIHDSVSSELSKIEFPDPCVVKETQMMVSKYLGIPSSNLDSDTCKTLLSCNSDNQLDSDLGVRLVESFSVADNAASLQPHKANSFGSSSSTDAVSSSADATLESLEVSGAASIDNGAKIAYSDDSLSYTSDTKSNTNVSFDSEIRVNKVPESTVVQQDIVDMYMKSMQQFTDSLAKMKLPLDIDNKPTSSSSSSSSEQKVEDSKNTPNSRVFYGSRAFF